MAQQVEGGSREMRKDEIKTDAINWKPRMKEQIKAAHLNVDL